MSGAAGVEEANARFYRAFETLDVREKDEVWAHGEHVRCVHPGWPPLCGWDAVRESWRTIFANTEEMRFTLSDVTVNVDGALRLGHREGSAADRQRMEPSRASETRAPCSRI